MKTGVYLHYKGGFYQCLGIGEHTETGERLVVYISLSSEMPGPRIRCRPEVMFIEEVQWPSGETKPRFLWIGDEIFEYRPELDNKV